MKFIIDDLGDFCDDIFEEMERISEGKHGNECVVDVAGGKLIAAEIITGKLIPFVKHKLREMK